MDDGGEVQEKLKKFIEVLTEARDTFNELLTLPEIVVCPSRL